MGEFELRGVCSRDVVVDAFIKDEKTNFTRKLDPAPRIIQPRKPVYNLAIGRILKPMEKAIFRGIAEVFRGVTVMKGYNADERGKHISGKWFKYSNPVAVLLDASRFDQHVPAQALRWEAGVFEACTSHPELFRRLNGLRRSNRCRIRTDDGCVQYNVDGCRMSGDMDTALGNCLLMCAMTWSFMRHLGIKDYSYVNDGDDGALIMERDHLEIVLGSYEQYFLRMGFTMKLEGVATELEQLEFCQARPIFDGINWRMVRDPRVCIGKDTRTLKRVLTPAHLRDLRTSIGWCGAALAGDMPIFCALYSLMVRGTEFVPQQNFETGMQFLARDLQPRFAQPTDDARASFFFAYGIAPEEQIAMESEILSGEVNDSMPVPSDNTSIYSTINLH
jgi:hypothetical protein